MTLWGEDTGTSLVVLHRWHKGISLTPEEPKAIPAWVKLFRIPTDLAHNSEISFVASKFSRLLLTDAVSARQGRMDFVCVCIELDASKGFRREANFFKLDGSPYNVRAEYERVPLHCPTCCIFGHSAMSCPKRKPTTKVAVLTKQAASQPKSPAKLDSQR